MSEFEWTIRYVIYTYDQLYDQLYFFLSDTFRCTIFNIENIFFYCPHFPEMSVFIAHWKIAFSNAICGPSSGHNRWPIDRLH